MTTHFNTTTKSTLQSSTQAALLGSALAAALTLGLAGAAAAADTMGKDMGKEKCFGVAKAGQNDCANLSGSHSCAGQAKMDMSADDWKLVAKGTCKDMKGMTEAEAKTKAKMKS